MSSIFTVYPGYRDYTFFTPRNVAYISKILSETMAKQFKQKIVFTDSSIMREMQRVFEERYETIPQMNRRVMLGLLRNAKNQYMEAAKNNYLLENQWNAYNYDPILGIQPYFTPKLNTRQRGMRFTFTY